MKLFYFHLICIFLITNVIFAQQDSLETEKTFGFGITFEQERFYFPVNISPSLRLEPEFYIRKFDSDDVDSYDQNFQTIKIGIGVFPKFKIKKICIYTGVRIGYHFDKSKDGEYKDTDEGHYIIPALGGEYLIENIFSLGFEYQLKYTSYNNTNVFHDKSESKEYNSSSFGSLTLFFLRFYVW